MRLLLMKNWLWAKFARGEDGANLVEYLLLVSLIAIAVMAAVVFFGGQVSSSFDNAGSKLSTMP